MLVGVCMLLTKCVHRQRMSSLLGEKKMALRCAGPFPSAFRNTTVEALVHAWYDCIIGRHWSLSDNVKCWLKRARCVSQDESLADNLWNVALSQQTNKHAERQHIEQGTRLLWSRYQQIRFCCRNAADNVIGQRQWEKNKPWSAALDGLFAESAYVRLERCSVHIDIYWYYKRKMTPIGWYLTY